MKDIIYAHIDAINNSVLTKGLTARDFNKSLRTTPNNLLLLSNFKDEGEYEVHTGLKMIRKPQVDNFLAMHSSNSGEGLKWIDFRDLQLIKQLTPVEISELLYFGHMNTHLHSPFFYKLQNNYVFLNVSDSINKIYYRHMDAFYPLLALKLEELLADYLFNLQRGFFKKPVKVGKLDAELLKGLRNCLQEGVVFHFPNIQKMDQVYILPVYLVEDKLRKVEETFYTEEMLAATLTYSAKLMEWKLEVYK